MDRPFVEEKFTVESSWCETRKQAIKSALDHAKSQVKAKYKDYKEISFTCTVKEESFDVYLRREQDETVRRICYIEKENTDFNVTVEVRVTAVK